MPAQSTIDALWPGRPYPRGATWDGVGVNFALFSEHAERVELCLFDASGRREVQRLALRERTDQVWHGYLPEARPGQLYGYRVYGPYRPKDGHRFNRNKLLLDPYARNIVGQLRWHDALFGYRIGHADADLSFDRRDSAPYMPRCKVVETAFSWGDDRAPDVPWHDTVIYEMHVRGFTHAASRRAAGAARHLCGAGLRAGDRPPAAPRRHRGRADAGACLRRRPPPGRARPAQLLGLQHDRLLRARSALQRVGQGRRVQDHGAARCTRPASR